MVVGTLSLVQKGQTSGCTTEWMHCNSDIWWWRQCLWCKKVKPVDAVDAVHSRHTTIYHYFTASTVATAYCIHWFDFFAPKTLSPPPYITIPMHPLCNASTDLTFLYQRQCPHHHIPLFHCI